MALAAVAGEKVGPRHPDDVTAVAADAGELRNGPGKEGQLFTDICRSNHNDDITKLARL